ncbi:hypothetical protein [Brevibacillus parabrevis]|uniref:hypothetical protein n=1 Tax=Brevibacillus parabrevis TaxID=54914 RepID=UPI0028D8D712|nr:hypothetical protein [Brevibacillus parabrevis]
MVLFLGGMNILSVFSKYSSPVVYIFIIGAAIWAITIAGGIGPIMEYVPAQPMNKVACLVMAISFLLSMSGAFLPQVAILSMLNQFAFFSGLILSFVLYTLFYKKQ